MRKRQFGSKKFIYASDHNTAQNYMEANIREVVADAGLAGVISEGGDLSPDPVSNYRIALDSIIARTSTGDRIVVPAETKFTIVPSGNPGALNERWVTAYIEYAYALAEEDTDGDGAAYYKDYTDSYVISTIQGPIAPIGTATRPDIPADSILLCDVLYDSTLYASGDIQQSDIDVSRRLQGGLDEYVRKDGDTMTGSLEIQDKLSAESIEIDWATSTGYEVGYIVSSGASLYKCLADHTSSATFESDIAYWQLQSGSRGADTFLVTSTGQTDFSLSFTPINKQDIIVSISGVMQHQDAFSLAGDIITFTEGLIPANEVQVLRIR